MKLFTTKSIETVKYCQEYFDFSLPSILSDLSAKRVAKFEVNFDFECFCLFFLFDFVCIAYCLLSTTFADLVETFSGLGYQTDQLCYVVLSYCVVLQ